MNRKDVLLRIWDIANQTKSWFAPVQKALENVDAIQAVWKPEGLNGFNTIQEITHHLFYYRTRFLSRLTGSAFETLTDNEATFIAGLSMDWEEIREELFETNSKILKQIVLIRKFQGAW